MATAILFDVDEFLKVEDLLEAVRTTLQLPQSMLEAQDAKPDAQPYQTFRSAIILREELVAGRPISPSPEVKRTCLTATQR